MINFLNASAFYVGLMKKNLREKKINPKMLFKFKKTETGRIRTCNPPVLGVLFQIKLLFLIFRFQLPEDRNILKRLKLLQHHAAEFFYSVRKSADLPVFLNI